MEKETHKRKLTITEAINLAEKEIEFIDNHVNSNMNKELLDKIVEFHYLFNYIVNNTDCIKEFPEYDSSVSKSFLLELYNYFSMRDEFLKYLEDKKK